MLHTYLCYDIIKEKGHDRNTINTIMPLIYQQSKLSLGI